MSGQVQPSAKAFQHIQVCAFIVVFHREVRLMSYACVTKTEYHQWHEAAAVQAGDHFQGTVWMNIFSIFCSIYSHFYGNFAAIERPLSFLAKLAHFLRAHLVQYVGIFSLFTLTAANYRPHSCSIYPIGNS